MLCFHNLQLLNLPSLAIGIVLNLMSQIFLGVLGSFDNLGFVVCFCGLCFFVCYDSLSFLVIVNWYHFVG